ncbi:MAG: acyl carrier protein [Myxococcota bacterium]
MGLVQGEALHVDVNAVIARIDRILVEEFELDEDKVVPEASLQGDLELDSLDGLDLVVALEKEFGFRVDDKVMLEMKTVADIHDYVRQVFAEQQGQQPG